jgi:hypothetical protein
MSQHRSQQEWLRLVQKDYNGEQPAAHTFLYADTCNNQHAMTRLMVI